MSATSAVLRGRAAAERLMLDTCSIKRLSGQVTDRETGVITSTYASVYAGKCKVQQQTRGGIPRPEDVGEAQVYLSRIEVHVPMSVTGIAADDIVTITASALDVDLVNRVFHIREIDHKTFLTARRLSVEEVTS